MEIVKAILPIAQVIIAIAVVTAILLQRNDAALGGVFGGSESVAHTKRGLERGLDEEQGEVGDVARGREGEVVGHRDAA